MVLNIASFTKQAYSIRLQKSGYLPRLLWLDKTWTIAQTHHYIFEYIKEVIAEWIDWKDPSTEKKPKSSTSPDLRTDVLIKFPYRPKDWVSD